MTLSVRRATANDLTAAIPLLAGMFQDLGTAEMPESWATDAATALRGGNPSEVGAFVCLDGERVVAVAVGLVEQRLPSPRRPDGRIGYVEWLATGSSDRRRGAARQAMEALMTWFGAQGVKVVDVHASASASPLYRDLGFAEPSSTSLRRVMPQ